jgi:hypothetical protein
MKYANNAPHQFKLARRKKARKQMKEARKAMERQKKLDRMQGKPETQPEETQ